MQVISFCWRATKKRTNNFIPLRCTYIETPASRRPEYWRHQLEQAKEFIKMPQPLHKIKVCSKNCDIRELSRIRNWIFKLVYKDEIHWYRFCYLLGKQSNSQWLQWTTWKWSDICRYNLFLNKVVFPAHTEYSYFSADFSLNIFLAELFLNSSVAYIFPFSECVGL